jgi:hypothetical protein
MANFKQYLTEELDKTTDEMARSSIMHDSLGDESLDDVIEKANPNVWTARIVNGVKYVIYMGKFLDLTETVKEIRHIYDINGYTGYGFSKLEEQELVRYTKTKNILMHCFDICTDDEVLPENVAEIFFLNELKEFDWKPEEY